MPETCSSSSIEAYKKVKSGFLAKTYPDKDLSSISMKLQVQFDAKVGGCVKVVIKYFSVEPFISGFQFLIILFLKKMMFTWNQHQCVKY